MEKDSKIYVAGHKGLVGSAIVRKLIKEGYTNIIFRTHQELDLVNQKDTEIFFETEQPEYVFMCAGLVGGIIANNEHKEDFIYQNIMMCFNVLHYAKKYNVKKTLFLGSSCIYPKEATQPIKENELLNGKLEPTNEGYALAKISAMKYCEYLGYNFISVMPTNMYGINDRYDLKQSHVIPALIKKIDYAKENNLPEVIIGGDGTPLREFLYVDDFADLCIKLMNEYKDTETINAGSGEEVSIKELAELICSIIGYKGKIIFDLSIPNGTHRKKLDLTKLEDFGWYAKTKLIDGLKLAYEDFKKNKL